MDTHRFDDLTRSLASGSSRRTVLRGLLGGVAALTGFRAGSTAAAPAAKIDVCHYDADTGTYHKINISQNASDTHLAHGDNADIGCAEGQTLNTDTCACEAAGPCPDCNCFSCWGTTEGEFFCVFAGTLGFLFPCTSSADCPAERPYCVATTEEGPNDPPTCAEFDPCPT